jgi:hypothetical protein
MSGDTGGAGDPGGVGDTGGAGNTDNAPVGGDPATAARRIGHGAGGQHDRLVETLRTRSGAVLPAPVRPCRLTRRSLTASTRRLSAPSPRAHVGAAVALLPLTFVAAAGAAPAQDARRHDQSARTARAGHG